MATESYAYIESKGFVWRGLVGGAVLGSCAVAVIFSAPLVPFSPTFRTLLTALGWASLCLGIGWRFWATLYVGGRKVGGHHEPNLTVLGPYSVVRNPLYVGSFCIGLSIALLLNSATLLVALLLAAWHYTAVVVPAEEEFLRRSVGPGTFDAYTARTPRWLPNFRLFESPRLHPFDARAVRKESLRAGRLLVAAVVLTLVAASRYEPWWPTLWKLP